jgi:hypothetical protein
MLVTACSGRSTGSATSSAPPTAVAVTPLSRAVTPLRVARRQVLPPGLFAQVTDAGQVLATAVQVAPGGPGQAPVTVVSFSPTRVRLVLHAGSVEPSAVGGWRYGPSVGRAERRVLVAAFNGGFKMRDARGGWRSEGRTITPLVRGGASVVIYRDGGVDIGAWGTEVPQPGRRVASVRQNLQLLVDHGRALLTHPRGQAQLDAWWGHAFQGQPLIARSALGVTATGALVWAAGDRTTVAALARALIHAGATRALELDINAPLVRGFLFSSPGLVLTSHHGRTAVVPLVVGQRQLLHDPARFDPAIAPHCTYLSACSRDFFTVLLR